MIKRVVSLILAVAMICSVMPVYATESAEVPAKASGTASGYDGSYGGAASGVTGGVAGGTAIDGGAASGGVVDEYTISGKLVLGDDVILENGLIDGFVTISLYEEGQTDFYPENWGEGNYNYSFYNKEDYTFSIKVPANSKVTVAAQIYPYRNEESTGEFRTNIVDGYVYYIGDCQSTTDSSVSEIITVDRDISGIEIPIQTGVECYFDATTTNDDTACFWVDMSFRTAEDEIMERTSLILDGGYGKGGVVLNKDLIGKELYLGYDIAVTGSEYYEENIYINPDGSYSLTLEDAIPFIITEDMQNISFSLAKKSQFMKTVKGKISFTEGCDLKSEGFYGIVYAKNTRTGERYSYNFSGESTEGTTYSITLPATTDEYYFYANMWVGDQSGNVSTGTYYYSSNGMTFLSGNATHFTLDNMPESIDFVYGKKATISGKLIADGEILNKENIWITAYIYSETGSYSGAQVKCDENLNYSITIPASVSGRTSMYIYVKEGSNILTNKEYYYINADGEQYFNITQGQDVSNLDIKVTLGDILRGKIKLPADAELSSRASFEVEIIRAGQRYGEFSQQVEIANGENEAEFVFALPKETTQRYMLAASGSVNSETNLYTDRIYYVSDTQSSEDINDATAFSLSEKNDITFMAVTGVKANVTIKNSYGAYLGGRCYIEFEDGKLIRENYYLSNETSKSFLKVLSKSYEGKKAYFYYDLNSAVKIYVNPDGTLTNRRELAQMHTFIGGYTFSAEISSDKSLYTIPSIKGTVSLPEGGYIKDENESEPYITSMFTLYDENWNSIGNENAWIYPEENGSFEFELGETGNYYLSMRVSTYYYETETNVVTSDTLYYSDEKGWTTKREEATLLANSSGEVNLDIKLPLSAYISGTVTFPEDAYIEGQVQCHIEISKVESGIIYNEYVNLSDTKDIDFSIKGGFGSDEYYVSFEFYEDYFSECDTNIELDRVYYYSKNGLTTDENLKTAVKATESITAEVPLKPTVKGKINLPENVVLCEGLRAYVVLCDENGNRRDSKEYTIGEDGFEFSLNGLNGIDKYTLEVYVYTATETNLETNTYFYYTSNGLTASYSEKEYFYLSELAENPIVLTLPKTRTVSGKIIIDDFEGKKPESVVVFIQSDTYGRTFTADLDENFCFGVKVPGGMQGRSTMYVRFDDALENNIIKNQEFYYTNGGEYSATFMLEMNKDVENLNIVAETGNVVSGTLVLPEDAEFTGLGDLSCDVGMGYYAYNRVTLSEENRSGDFWLVVPKNVGSSSLFVSPGNGAGSICSNLYTYDDTFYVSDAKSTIYGAKATSLNLNKENRNLVLLLQTGTPYVVNFTKEADITANEQASLHIGNEENSMYTFASKYSNETSYTAKLVIPEEFYGMDMYLYYDLTKENNNNLYREKVYINKDGSLTGSKKLADIYKIDNTPREFDVTYAKYSDLKMPDYIYSSTYPYKNNQDNTFSYEYTEGDCDYLKVTFAPETYLGYYDYADIYDKDGQQVGRYSSGSLAGKSVNIPGNGFTVSIEGDYCYTAFGIAIESIEPKKYTLETDHPYISSEKKSYPYTHKTEADGLRLYFSEDTDFYGYMTITYTHNGEIKEKGVKDYNIAGNYVDIRGNSFTITMPADNSGDYYGFTIVEIEEIEYFDVTFKNYDGTVLDETEVEKGESVYYNKNTPVRERDEDYIYTFEGWDKSLDNIQEDIVLTAQFRGNPYATVQFKNNAEDENVLYTDYVILGERASFDGEIKPSKASTETKAYVFACWSRSLNNIKEDTVITAEFEECDILVQSAHPYTADEGIKAYTYNGSADSIMLVFSSDSVIDENSELIIYDENDTPIYYLSGNITEEPITVTGKTAKFEIVGEGNGKFGYALAKVEPMWHDFRDWYQYDKPDCTNEGTEYRWCYNCYTEEERTVPALGHSFGAWEEDTDGNIFRECIRCPEREVAENSADMGVVNITVVDAVTMEPLENVTLTAYDEEGNETVWYTNEEGVAPQILKKGVNNLVVFAKDYIMRNVSIQVNAGITNVPVIGLTEKPAVECKINATPMTKDEMIEAGIDINAYENQHIYKYEINIGFGEPKSVYFTEGGKHVDTGGNLYVHNDETGDGATIHPINDKYYLVIYGNSKWLKEMFDVELVAFNTSNTDTVENLTAEIKIPDGMSLAAMNTLPQSDVQRMGSLASGESKSVHWYLRGDDAGEYNISAKLTGTLMPFDEQFGYEYTTDESVKVYAGDALQMNIVVPAIASYGEDYTVKIEIENVSDRSVYNLSNSIDRTLQSKFLSVDTQGYEKYFEENALGYIAVDELKSGEKIVAELKANILFQSDVIKDKIETLANRLQGETDVLAIFNSFKSTLDLLNDNYDIIYNALRNVEMAKNFKELETLLNDCAELVKLGSSSRAMYFINRLKQENTLEELTNLSKDSNFYMVWSEERLNKLYDEMRYLYSEALKPENCSDYDIYEDVKKTLRAVPVNFWFKDLFVAKLGGSTTEIPYTVKVIPSDGSHTQITNISNYYYNILTGAIEMLSQPWYTEIIGEIRDGEGVAGAKEIIKTDTEKSLTFAVTDVSGDTRFNAWVEGEDGKHFTVSSTAEETQVTESGITFIGSAYLTVGAETTGKGTLYIEKVSEIATFGARTGAEAFEIEVVDAHNCASEKWVEMVTAYDDNDGYDAKYCDVCNTLIDIRCVKATDRCDGSYQVTEEKVTEEGYSCILTFDEETPSRSAVAVVVMKDENGRTVKTGTDAIKIKPSSTVEVKVPFENAEGLQPKLMLWDSLTRLRPIGK